MAKGTSEVAAPARRSGRPGRPGSAAVVAMVGAGQLAQMTHQAASALGVELRVLATGEHESAVLSGAPFRLGSPERLEDLLAFAEGADVVTFDHEGVPPEHLAALEEAGVALAPTPGALLFAQDKLHARRELAARGYPVPDFADARTPEDVEAFAARHGWPLIAKAPRGGYDGRGVFPLADAAAGAAALAEHPRGLLLEPLLAIEQELAVLVARSRSGESVVYPVVETVQREAMCREILAPAAVAPQVAEQASGLAVELANEIDATGVLAVELFLTPAGLLVNELALRPHNSGHYTIEGCETSQFEQHLRAVLGWPLGRAGLRAPAVATVNVVGGADGEDPRRRLPRALAVPGAHFHLYGKAARPGRKLGHVTVAGAEPSAAREAALTAAGLLEGGGR